MRGAGEARFPTAEAVGMGRTARSQAARVRLPKPRRQPGKVMADLASMLLAHSRPGRKAGKMMAGLVPVREVDHDVPGLSAGLRRE